MKIYLVNYRLWCESEQFVAATKNFSSATSAAEMFINDDELYSQVSWEITPMAPWEWIYFNEDNRCSHNLIIILEVDLDD